MIWTESPLIIQLRGDCRGDPIAVQEAAMIFGLAVTGPSQYEKRKLMDVSAEHAS